MIPRAFLRQTRTSSRCFSRLSSPIPSPRTISSPLPRRTARRCYFSTTPEETATSSSDQQPSEPTQPTSEESTLKATIEAKDREIIDLKVRPPSPSLSFFLSLLSPPHRLNSSLHRINTFDPSPPSVTSKTAPPATSNPRGTSPSRASPPT